MLLLYAQMYAMFPMKVALAEDISKNGTIILRLVAAKNLCMEAVVVMAIASVLWRSVKPSVFIVKNYFLVATTQRYLTKVTSSMLCMFPFQNYNNDDKDDRPLGCDGI
jgi:hypothetical protein